MSLGPWQIALIVLLLLVLFGRGRISDMMGDFGKGISSFKKGLKEGEESGKSEDAKPRIVDQTGPHQTPQADVKAESVKDDSAS